MTPTLLTHPPLALARSETQLQQLEVGQAFPFSAALLQALLACMYASTLPVLQGVPACSAGIAVHTRTLGAALHRPKQLLGPPPALQATHRIYDLYCWLAYRFQDAFAGGEQAAAARALCARLIDESIRRMPPWARDSGGGSSCEGGSDESEGEESASGSSGSIRDNGGRSSERRGVAAGAGAGGKSAAKRQGRREQQPVEAWQEVLAEARAWAKENVHSWSEVITDSSSEEEGWLVEERRKCKRAYAKRRRGRG